MNESRRLSANTPTRTQVNHLPRGNRGPEGAGAPRPSGAGSTRQPLPVGSGGGRGGVAEDDSGAGRLMLRVLADRLVRHAPSVPVGPVRVGLADRPGWGVWG